MEAAVWFCTGMTASEIDYNYYTHPDTLNAWVERTGGWAEILTFCQLNQVQIVRGADYSYGALINSNQGTWSTDMDALSALVIGVINYKEKGPKETVTT
jgi:hypothetical protein